MKERCVNDGKAFVVVVVAVLLLMRMLFLLCVLTTLPFILPFLSFPSPFPSLTHPGPSLLFTASSYDTVRRKQPRTSVSPVDIPFADEINDSFDLQDGGHGGGGGTHVIIRDVKMTINDQEIVLNRRSDGLMDPITAARIQTKPPYIEERHPKFRVIDSHN